MDSSLDFILMKARKADAVNYLFAHPEDFEKTIQFSISDEPKMNWRAAWLLTNCMEDNDARIQPYLDEMVNAIKGKNDGHQRELMKILLRMDLSEEHESYLFDFCVAQWESVKLTPSVRYIAFRMMMKVAASYPELKNEILMLTQPQYVNSLSPGIQNSVRKMIKKLEK